MSLLLGCKMKQQISYQNLYSNNSESMTLAETLDAHYKLNPQFTAWDKHKSEIGRNLIKAHDITHVVFGCDTSFVGELRVQLWTKHAVDFNIVKGERLKYLFDKDARSLLTPVGMIPFIIFNIGTIIKEYLKVKNQSKFMLKKWVYFKESEHMDKSLQQIRSEFGIKII